MPAITSHVAVMSSFERSENGFTTNSMFAKLDFNGRVHGQIDFHARAELDQADPVSTHNFVTFFDPWHNPARNHSRNQTNRDFFSDGIGAFNAEENVFIMGGAFGPDRIKKLASRISKQSDLAAERSVLDMHVDHRMEHGNAPALPAHKQRLCGGVDDIDLAVTRRKNEPCAHRHPSIGVAKEIDCENGKEDPHNNDKRSDGRGDNGDDSHNRSGESSDGPNRHDGD